VTEPPDSASECAPGLAEADARALVHLVAECAVVPGGIMAQKKHLMDGLVGLVDATHWMWNVARIEPDGTVFAVSLHHNVSEQQLARLADETYSHQDNPIHRAIGALCTEHASWSRRMEDMLDADAESEWLTGFRRDLDMGQSIFSMRSMTEEPPLTSAVGIHRPFGATPFSERDLRLVHIVMSEVDWLHRPDAAPAEDGSSVVTLAPRLQTVLALLIDGQPSKSIANHLGLSPHTVRDYVKQVYRHFEVGSHIELMRRFMVGDGLHRELDPER